MFLYNFSTRGIPVGNALFGNGSGPIWLDNVLCNGQELDLGKCGHTAWNDSNCIHREDAGVICVPNNS